MQCSDWAKYIVQSEQALLLQPRSNEAEVTWKRRHGGSKVDMIAEWTQSVHHGERSAYTVGHPKESEGTHKRGRSIAPIDRQIAWRSLSDRYAFNLRLRQSLCLLSATFEPPSSYHVPRRPLCECFEHVQNFVATMALTGVHCDVGTSCVRPLNNLGDHSASLARPAATWEIFRSHKQRTKVAFLCKGNRHMSTPKTVKMSFLHSSLRIIAHLLPVALCIALVYSLLILSEKGKNCLLKSHFKGPVKCLDCRKSHLCFQKFLGGMPPSSPPPIAGGAYGTSWPLRGYFLKSDPPPSNFRLPSPMAPWYAIISTTDRSDIGEELWCESNAQGHIIKSSLLLHGCRHGYSYMCPLWLVPRGNN